METIPSVWAVWLLFFIHYADSVTDRREGGGCVYFWSTSAPSVMAQASVSGK